MLRKTVTGILLATMLAWAQDYVISAPYVKRAKVKLDGKLKERVWKKTERISVVPGPMTVAAGKAEKAEDCSFDFALFWDDAGLYCGMWMTDDVHHAPFSKDEKTAKNMWRDDAIEFFIGPDFEDVYADMSVPYFGKQGWQLTKPLTWNGKRPEERFFNYHRDLEHGTISPEEMKTRGFEARLHSKDGIRFQCEAFWPWEGAILKPAGKPVKGKELGFNLGIVDNDGSQTGDTWMRWNGEGPNEYQGWGKVTLTR